MRGYVARRALQMVFVVFGVITVTFFAVRLVPGDPARIMVGGQRTSEETLANIRRAYNLDKPLPVQYGLWVGDLVRGNLGISFRQRADVRTLILDRLPLTAKLAAYSFAISLLIAIPLGIVAAVKRNGTVDFVASLFALLGASSPVFFTAILLILLFSYRLDWLPALGAGDGGMSELVHLLLPSLTLGISLAAVTTRITRSAMVEALTQDYIETARAKGLSARSVVLKHAFRNAQLPILTVLGLEFGSLLGGAIVTEKVFAWPGMGTLLLTSIERRDYNTVRATVLVFTLCYVLVNALTDVAYALVDPRVRRRG